MSYKKKKNKTWTKVLRISGRRRTWIHLEQGPNRVINFDILQREWERITRGRIEELPFRDATKQYILSHEILTFLFFLFSCSNALKTLLRKLFPNDFETRWFSYCVFEKPSFSFWSLFTGNLPGDSDTPNRIQFKKHRFM